jgi:two-component system, NarL family, response regulator YdfI
MTQVAILAAQQSRRSWLERNLRADPSLKIAGLASTFAFLRSLLNEVLVDVVVVDEPESESEIVRDWLSEILDTVPLVMLCTTPDAWIYNQIVNVGERGAILNRDASVEQIVHAVRATLAGLLVFDSSLIPRPDVGDELAVELTAREIQVLRLLAEGLVNREIADRLHISEHTIKFHIGSILGKLQASSRTEAVTRGLRAGIIEL